MLFDKLLKDLAAWNDEVKLKICSEREGLMMEKNVLTVYCLTWGRTVGPKNLSASLTV